MDVSAGMGGGHDKCSRDSEPGFSHPVPVGILQTTKLEDALIVPKTIKKTGSSSRRELCLLRQVLSSILVSPHRCAEQERKI